MRPHDLLQLKQPGLIQTDLECEPGGASEVEQIPFVVVRRASFRDSLIPVGVRGRTRGERYAGWLHPKAILTVHTPESLAAVAPRRALPAFDALRSIALQLQGKGIAWGPTGSAGFELASGHETVTISSDLDLVLRAPGPLALDELKLLARLILSSCVFVDVQVEAPAGAFALREYLNTGGPCALRTSGGPVLVDDPWQYGEHAEILP